MKRRHLLAMAALMALTSAAPAVATEPKDNAASTSTQVDLIFRYRVKPGKEALYQSYLNKVLPVVEAQEADVLEYSIYQQADGTYLQHERYVNEEAVAKHLELTADGQKDNAASIDIIDVMAVGDLKADFWKNHEGPHFTRYRRLHSVTR